MNADREYSVRTIEQYNCCITSIRRLYIDDTQQDFILPDGLGDSEHILQLLSKTYKKQTVMNFLSAILWKLKQFSSDTSRQIQEIYHAHTKRMKEEIERENIGKECELTEKEKKSFMLWEKIQEIYAEMTQTLDRTNYNSFMNFVIVSLYVLHPPVRADYSGMRIFVEDSHVPDDIKENYCVLNDTPRFVFQQYKNAKHRGITVIPMDPNLHDILLDWVEINPSDYLLASYVNSRKIFKPFTDNNLCKRIPAIFLRYSKTPVTVNTLRHSFISFMSRNDQMYDQKRDNADKMMHSVGMADKYRRMVYLS